MTGRLRCRRLVLRAVTATFGLAMALGLSEAVLWLAGYDRHYVNPQSSFHQPDPRFGYIGKPNFAARFHTPDFNVLVEHNELGFRRHVYGSEARPDRPALYVLGDSFTWGWGVEQGQVYSDLIARQAGDAYSVLNFGLSATGTVQQAAIFDSYVRDQLKPGDTVLVAAFSNDFPDNLHTPLRGVVENGQVRILDVDIEPSQAVKRWLKENCRTFNVIAYAIDLHMLQFKRRQEEAVWRTQVKPDSNLSLPRDSAEYLVMRETLRRVQQDCRLRGARFIAAYIPGHAEIGESMEIDVMHLWSQAGYREAFFNIAEEIELETIDLLPYFLDAKRSGHCGRTTFARDMHWNDAGHAVAADAIAGVLAGRPAPLLWDPDSASERSPRLLTQRARPIESSGIRQVSAEEDADGDDESDPD